MKKFLLCLLILPVIGCGQHSNNDQTAERMAKQNDTLYDTKSASVQKSADQIKYESAAQYLDSGDYKDASAFFDSMQSQYKDSDTLRKIANGLNMYQVWKQTHKQDDGVESAYNLSSVDKLYWGKYADNIQKAEDGLGQEIMNQGHAMYVEYDQASNSASQHQSTPTIGMTADQVKQTDWGDPQRVNKTSTATTTNEQWVYGNGRYVYLENGVVTAVQDSR